MTRLALVNVTRASQYKTKYAMSSSNYVSEAENRHLEMFSKSLAG